jgi:hypothetical protein
MVTEEAPPKTKMKATAGCCWTMMMETMTVAVKADAAG